MHEDGGGERGKFSRGGFSQKLLGSFEFCVVVDGSFC
jgi:hypothetical protein